MSPLFTMVSTKIHTPPKICSRHILCNEVPSFSPPGDRLYPAKGARLEEKCSNSPLLSSICGLVRRGEFIFCRLRPQKEQPLSLRQRLFETVKKVFLTVSPPKCKHFGGIYSPLQRTDFVPKIRAFVGWKEFFARRMSVQKMKFKFISPVGRNSARLFWQVGTTFVPKTKVVLFLPESGQKQSKLYLSSINAISLWSCFSLSNEISAKETFAHVYDER